MAEAGRREILKAAGATALFILSQQSTAKSTRLTSLYDRATVIDGLASLGAFDNDYTEESTSILPHHIAEIRRSGVTAINLTAGGVGNGPGKFDEAIKTIADYESELARYPDLFLLIRSALDLRVAKDSGKVGVIYGFQDTSMLDGDLSRLDYFHDLGVRIVQPVYNLRNLMGDGCLEPNNGGLSLLGRELIEKLNERRFLVDFSHAGSRVQAEGIARSKRPCAITHSGCRALVDFPRNTRDEELRALADGGGVMGIYFMPFLRAGGQPMAEDVIRHIEHAVNVAGEDHVGIGSDGAISAVRQMDDYRAFMKSFVARRVKLGIAAPGESAEVVNLVPEYNSPRRLELLAYDLLKRGHSSRRVEKILGGNFARLFDEVWG